MDAGSSSSPLHIVVVPWLAFGHLLPYLELSERLAERGHRVSYVSTPRNLARLPTLRSAAAPRVDLVALPLPRVDGLPDGAESTNDVPDDKRELHFKAFDGLAAPFAAFMAAACADEATRPHWVIADCFHHWVAAAAFEHKVPCALLLPTAALIATAHRDQPAEARVVTHTRPRYEEEEVAPIYDDHGASGMSIVQRFYLTKEKCALAAIRSCVEWEPESFPLVPTVIGLPVVPLGLLPPSPDGGRRADGINGSAEHATVRWLDAQPAGSVVYVALGSEVPLRVEQVHELALGLELAGTRFLWALRKPSGAAVHDDDADMLPPGFQERTGGQGLVTTGWVPQMSILAHAAVGGFLTHCGRNSLIEGLLFGHPLVMLPIFGDQGPNARQMEVKKVGLQVARNEDDGSFDRHGVASAIRAVMVDGDARRSFVAGAAKMQEVVANTERQERYVDEFVHRLRSYTAEGHFSTAPTSL
ncbi:UDP-glycosyltransferase 91C1-like [Triticum dicoccoides]|uniref:UDP-glycosyltransferase 91C1-like n=1 Tax=Triticum dicoccoides TaxID=85692 RepID=UPI00084538EF|nr:UDP-glycosyltransferase 91C1-like [Triticum dicoccoides]XP_044394085.1 UDP-glycosyltransferase 91C1-like [Triticum aestivum]